MNTTAWIVVGVAIGSIATAVIGYLMVHGWAKEEAKEQSFEPRYKMRVIK